MQDIRDDTVVVGPVGVEWAFWFGAGQILAASFAFSLLVLVSNFIAFELRGPVLSVFEIWTGTIRPAAISVVQLGFSQLPTAWQVQVPPLGGDYLATGVLLALALWRQILSTPRTIDERPPMPLKLRLQGALLLVATALCWPLFLFLILPFAQTHVGGKFFSEEFVLWLVPLIYLGAIFAVNAIR